MHDLSVSKHPKMKTSNHSLVALAAALLLAASSTPAANLLVNQSFEADGYNHVIPTGWTRYAPPTAAIYQPGGNYWNEDDRVALGLRTAIPRNRAI